MKTLCLVLGGSGERERRCIKEVCQQQPDTPVWLSGPALTEDCLDVCKEQGCDVEYLLVDYRALDTLSNFTTLLPDMKQHKFCRIRLVTSTYHIERAITIARVLVPSYDLSIGRSIIVPPCAEERKESRWIVFRDFVRAYLYLWFGVDVTYPLIWLLHPERIKQRDRRIRNYTFHGNKCYG